MKALPVEEARARILGKAARMEAQTVLLDDALGRVLAAPVIAARDQPPFDASAMDGWAVRGEGLTGPARILGESAAGKGFAGEVGRGEAVRIFTGAPVPSGADTVIIQEQARRDGDQVAFESPPLAGANIRTRGGDFRAGQILLKAGERLDPWRISLAAAAGADMLSVARRPRLRILSTGDEITEPGGQPGPYAIFNSCGPAIAALARSWGAEASRFVCGDDLEATAQLARDAEGNLLITIGGASVGDHDLVRPALERLGLELEVLSLNMRPGRPMWFGLLADGRRVLGLPGNPASAMVCAQLFLRPLLAAMQGADPGLGLVQARLTAPLGPNGPREHWMRARLEFSEGTALVTPFGDQDSSLIQVFAQADALLRRPGQAPAAKTGDLVEVLPLDRR